MALINCPECEKQISDKALACPNCGYPIANTDNTTEDLLEYPELPSELSIGKPLVNWGGDARFVGQYDMNENVVEKIRPGSVLVMLNTHGIDVVTHFPQNHFQIHNLQIISIKQTSRTELISLDKSVIGRAAVGAIILGPLGALVGGMTASNFKDKSYMIVNYWDVDTKKAQTLLISGNKNSIKAFINKYKTELKNTGS